jgi:hypothetical protein
MVSETAIESLVVAEPVPVEIMPEPAPAEIVAEPAPAPAAKPWLQKHIEVIARAIVRTVRRADQSIDTRK